MQTLNTVLFVINVITLLGLGVGVLPKAVKEAKRGGLLSVYRYSLLIVVSLMIVLTILALQLQVCIFGFHDGCSTRAILTEYIVGEMVARGIATSLFVYLYNKDILG